MSKDIVTETEMQGFIFRTAESGAREYAGQTASNNAHIDIRALACVQGSSKFVHKGFRLPIIVDVVEHLSSSESTDNGPSTAETKRFIH